MRKQNFNRRKKRTNIHLHGIKRQRKIELSNAVPEPVNENPLSETHSSEEFSEIGGAKPVWMLR